MVGLDGLVCGIDSSDSMLALARIRTTRPNSASIELRQAGADQLPYTQASFDVAVATQVLEYVQDVPGALAEVTRVLRPGGRVLVLDTDWDSIVWHSSDEERMARVLAAWEQHLVDPHLPRRLRGWLERAGLQVAPPQVVPLCNVGFDPATYSAGLLEGMVGFVVGRDGLTAEEVQAWAADLRSLAPRPSSASTATCSARRRRPERRSPGSWRGTPRPPEGPARCRRPRSRGQPWQLKRLRAGDVLGQVAAVARRQPDDLGPHHHQAGGLDAAKQAASTSAITPHDHDMAAERQSVTARIRSN